MRRIRQEHPPVPKGRQINVRMLGTALDLPAAGQVLTTPYDLGLSGVLKRGDSELGSAGCDQE